MVVTVDLGKGYARAGSHESAECLNLEDQLGGQTGPCRRKLVPCTKLENETLSLDRQNYSNYYKFYIHIMQCINLLEHDK